MAFNVTDFKEAMTYDGARPNLFKVTFTDSTDTTVFKPSSMSSPAPDMFCRASSIPGATLGAVVVPYFGREVKFAGNRTYADWTVTVINDETFEVRSMMEKWMNQINLTENNTRSGALAAVGNYYATATVHQLSKQKAEETVRSYTFNNMFPIDISEITLDWGDNDSIEEFTCTFAYDYWTSTAGASFSAKQSSIT